ncbi:MAG: glycosyltransferase, partial [Candidatus Nanohaloarchaea archaeon]
MRIGFFSDSYFPSLDGVTYTLKSWRERLEERGHEVFIFYPGSPDYKPGENEIPLPSVPNPFYRGYRIPLPWKVDVPELDVVHCHTPFTLGRLGARVANKQSIPKIYTHHTPVEEYFEQNLKSRYLSNALAKAYIPLESRFLRGFDRVTTSTGDCNRGVETEKLPVGVDLEFFKPTEGFELKEDFENPLIGYSGRISKEKNVSRIVENAEKMPGTVIIVGEGPLKKKIMRKAPDKVIFKDFLPREQLPAYYSALDVFVTASTGDTLGLSTLEANACGTPVVAPDVHPFDKTIGEENGERFDLEGSMAEKVVTVLQGSYSCREAVRRFSLEKTV